MTTAMPPLPSEPLSSDPLPSDPPPSDPLESSLIEAMMSGFVNRDDRADDELEPALIVNHDGRTMKRALSRELETSDGFDMSVAFISQSALLSLKQSFIDFSSRATASGRIVTSTFNYFNSPRVFQELLKLQATTGITVRIWEPAGERRLDRGFPFHPKGYVFIHRVAGTSMISTYVGSSNLTSHALSSNREWNLKVNSTDRSAMSDQLRSELDAQIADTVPLTQEWIDEYARTYAEHAPAMAPRTATDGSRQRRITPNAMQVEALHNLAELRRRGEGKAIVISATGTGKTYLAAFDVRQFAPRRALYLVHQEQILERSKESFRQVLASRRHDLGTLTGHSHDYDERTKVLFSTIQTMSRDDVLSSFGAADFDYILIDEVHHAAAGTYRKILDHFRPRFLLGMTATPERTDGENIFDLFGNNVAYEIRLRQALDAGLLCDFHYYGVHDCVDQPIDDGPETTGPLRDPTLTQRRKVPAMLSILTNDDRVSYIIDKLDLYGQAGVRVRGLVFCSRVEEAEALSDAFNKRVNRATGKRYRTTSLSGSSSRDLRSEGIRALDSGDLEYIFTVDLFNEGIDIPHVNQIVMLRQTQSSIIFTQQLGRGLRRVPGKDCVTVIDFIGNYANNYLIPLALYGNTGDRDVARRNMQIDMVRGCSVSFDPIARERVLRSLDNADLSDMRALSEQYRRIRYEINRIPSLVDIAARDPSLVSTMALKSRNYLAFVRSRESSLGRRAGSTSFASALEATTPAQDGVLTMLTTVMLKGLRPHEALILARLCGILDAPEGTDDAPSSPSRDAPTPSWRNRRVTADDLASDLEGLFPLSDRSPRQIDSAFRTLDLSYFVAGNRKRFGSTPLVAPDGDGGYRISPALSQWLSENSTFARFFLDTIRASLLNAHALQDHLAPTSITPCGFIYGEKYSVFDVMRLCGWSDEQIPQNVGGYRFDPETSTMPILIKYESSQYEDRFLDTRRIRWVSKNGRTLRSPEYVWLMDDIRDAARWRGSHTVPVFVRRRRETQETTYYFVGMVRSITDLHETSNADSSGKRSGIVVSTLTLERPVTPDLFEHLTGSPTI